MKNIIYGFTNENVSSYERIYSFQEARVLSVLGSGDQYFASLLYGAKEVDLFDINPLAWDYFVLKNYAIAHLKYRDFYEYFVLSGAQDNQYFHLLEPFLPKDVKYRLENENLDNHLISTFVPYGNGEHIPYFEPKKYQTLQSILLERELPTFYLQDFSNLLDSILPLEYDILLTSNIYDWIRNSRRLDASSWKNFLEQFPCQEVQAHYLWSWTSDKLRQYEKNGYEITPVSPARTTWAKEHDYVLSLRKTKK